MDCEAIRRWRGAPVAAHFDLSTDPKTKKTEIF